MTALGWIVPIVLAAVLSAVLGHLVRRWALRRAWFDVPNARSSHVVPTPRGGGVGIVVGFVVGLVVWVAWDGALSPRAIGWFVGALLVAAISLADDLHPLPVRVRLLAHTGAAVLLTVVGVQDRELTALVALPLAFFWVALVTNLYNFMDGIDGLAAGQAIVAGAAYAAGGVLVKNPLLAVAGGLLASAAAGFLLHNLPPARLFMGDVGSIFLGFNFAGLALLGNLGVGGGRLPMEFGIVVLAPFLFDGIATLARRVLRGERWFEAHRSHYYQRLVRAGRSHAEVSAVYVAVAVLASAAALCGVVWGEPVRQALAVVAFLPMLGLVAVVWRLERAVPSTAAS